MTEAIKEVVSDQVQEGATDTGAVDGGKQEEGTGTTEDTSGGAGQADDNAGGDDKSSLIPDNWRELAAGTDEDMLKLLKRYGSLGGVTKALKEAQATIRSGKLRRDMPDPKDDKAMAEWRKEQGIPDDPTGYKLPDAVTTRLVDEDKPILSSFTEFAHAKNLPPAAVEAAAEWYVDMQEKAETARKEADDAARGEAEDALRDVWSRDEYKGNLTLAKRFMASATEVGDAWTEARLPDGRRLGDIAGFVQWASDMGRQQFGDTVFASADSEAKHNSRKAEIEEIMKTDINRYHAEKLDAEYVGILEKEAKRRK